MTDIRFYALDDKGNRYDFCTDTTGEIAKHTLSYKLFEDAEFITVHCDAFDAKAGDAEPFAGDGACHNERGSAAKRDPHGKPTFNPCLCAAQYPQSHRLRIACRRTQASYF